MYIIKKNRSILISTIITGLFLLVYMITKKMEPFGTMSLVNYDCQSQVYPFLCALHDKLVKGESFFYMWNAGLGDGFLPTYFYYLSSPINLLVAFVDKSNIRSFINITIFFRMTISALNMAIFLSGRFCYVKKTESNATESENISPKDIYIIPLSVGYALSGFVFGFYHESMWLDSYMIFPLVMFGYDRMMRDRRPVVYILSLVYSSICSFYMTFMIGFFLVLWFLLEKCNKQIDKHSIKDFAHDVILFGVSSALAIGMTALSLIVSYIGVMKTHVQAEPEIVHKWFGNIFNIIRYQFIFSTPINVSYDNNCANLYCGTFAVVLLFVYMFSGKIKLFDRIKRITLILFIMISFNEAILNFIWHGFHYQLCIPNRFAFLYIFLVLFTAYETLLFADNIKFTIIGLVLAELLPMVSYYFVDYDSLIGSKKTLIVSLIIVLIYSTFMILNISIKKQVVYIIFSIIMTCELFANAFMSISFDLSEAGRFDDILKVSQNYVDDFESQNKDSFYRSKLLGTVLKNTDCIIGTRGVSVFNSMIGSEVLEFSENYGYFRTDVAIDENGGFTPLDDIIGTKYFYAVDEPFLNNSDYKLINSSEVLDVYQNPNALSLGFAVNNDIKNVKNDKTEIIRNINNLTSSMTGCKDLMEEKVPDYHVSGEGYEVRYGNVDYLYIQIIPNGKTEYPYVQITFDTTEDGLYNSYINYSDFGIVSIYVNNELRRYEYTSFGGVLNLGKLYKGDKVDFIIQSENRMADGYTLVNNPTIEIRLEKIENKEYQSFIDYLKSSEMKISEFKVSNFNADIKLKEKQILFTTIPYDDSWHIYENGKEINKTKLVNAFIGLDLGVGEHSLEFKYIPKGFYSGLIISIISWILFILWIFLVGKMSRLSRERLNPENGIEGNCDDGKQED